MKAVNYYSARAVFYCTLLLTVSCSSSSDPDFEIDLNLDPDPIPLEGPPTVIGYTDYGRLKMTGTRIGTNTNAVANLRKQIGFTLVNENPNFTFGVSYAARDSTNDTSLTWILSVTNVSADERFCYIRLIKGEYRSAAGDVLDTDDDIRYINGSVGKLPVSGGLYYFHTDSCLGPGETGHFLNLVSDLTFTIDMYDQVDNVVYDNIYGDSVTDSTLEATITPQSYTSYVPSIVGNTDIVLDVINTGTQTGRMTISQFLLLDDADQPLTWWFLASTGPNYGVIPAGQKSKIGGSIIYHGVSHTILPYLDYEDYTDTLTSTLANTYSKEDFATPVQYTQHLLTLRNEKQSLMRSYLEQ